MNLIDVTKQFPTDEECLGYIEKMRWPDGVVRCPICGVDKISRITRKGTSKNVRQKHLLVPGAYLQTAVLRTQAARSSMTRISPCTSGSWPLQSSWTPRKASLRIN